MIGNRTFGNCLCFGDFSGRILSPGANKNGTIDWLEADTYRRGIRKRILVTFDANKDGRLRGAERKKANQLLEAGKTPSAVKKTAYRTSGGGRKKIDAEMLEQYDANGDGVLSEEEIQTAMKDMQETRRAEMMRRYDTDGDGKLSKTEREAMYQDQNRGGGWQKMQQEWGIRLFDEDGDGQIDEEEKAGQKEFGQQLQQVMNDMQLRVFDADGDGQISKEERSLVQKEMMVIGVRMMFRFRRLMDTSGDGKVSSEEREGFQTRLAGNFGTWVNGFSNTFDMDGNGRFDAEERKGLVQGIENELDNRMTKHDANKDGRTDPFEVEKMLFEFMGDIGVAPRTKATTAPVRK